MVNDPKMGRTPRDGLSSVVRIAAGVFGLLFMIVLWTATSQGGPGGRTWGWRRDRECELAVVTPGGLCHDDDSSRPPPAALFDLAPDTGAPGTDSVPPQGAARG